mmetsp:Transcript_59403/g.133877  ORF Transcript_59403/g.133877 Transcript_59403/m.133877 type:complete len:202 (-) Transcript_59403:118-723(-)
MVTRVDRCSCPLCVDGLVEPPWPSSNSQCRGLALGWQLKPHLPLVSAPHRPEKVVLRAADRPASVGMHQEVQVAPVCHHPWDGIRVSVHGQEDGEVRSDEWGNVGDAGSRGVHGEGAERGLVEDVSLALGDAEMLDEGLAKGPGKLGAVRVPTEVPGYIRIEEDVDVVRLEGLRSWLARAALFVSRGMRVRIRQGEDGEEK